MQVIGMQRDVSTACSVILAQTMEHIPLEPCWAFDMFTLGEKHGEVSRRAWRWRATVILFEALVLSQEFE